MATAAEKQQNLQALLDKGVVMMHLDARRAGVRVPDYLKTQEWLRLNFNHTKGREDLVINGWGVRETLRFNGAWFPVSVPWSAVFALSSPEQGAQPTIFADDLPEEMVEAALARLQREGYSLEDLEMNRPQSLWAEKSEKPAVEPVPSADQEAKPEKPRQVKTRAERSPKSQRSEARRTTPQMPMPALPAAPATPPTEPPRDVGEIRRGHLRLVK